MTVRPIDIPSHNPGRLFGALKDGETLIVHWDGGTVRYARELMREPQLQAFLADWDARGYRDVAFAGTDNPQVDLQLALR
jgi:hypothetical protein